MSQLENRLEIDAPGARELLEHDDSAILVDVRGADEWAGGYIPGATLVPLRELTERIGDVVPDRAAPVVLYCAVGARSLRAAQALSDLGYERPVSIAGGIVDWMSRGYPSSLERTLDPDQRERYSRHLLIPEVGELGQLKLLDSSVLLIGAGGLGSPAALYLAAAGVGRLGIVDDDVVDESNLQRQVLHSTSRLGELKARSAKRTLEELNPDVDVVTIEERITSENVDAIFEQGWDVIIDGADNFPTRYLLNDAAVWHGIPIVHGSIFRFEGQATVFKPH
jgi:sulfur-carrier protein adenylyltransferase/sulfurtransferase